MTSVPAPEQPTGPPAWSSSLSRVALLSSREQEVFLLLGTGASNRTIAGTLGVAERTVKAHVAQILAKIRVESRLQAGLVALLHRISGQDGRHGYGEPVR